MKLNVTIHNELNVEKMLFEKMSTVVCLGQLVLGFLKYFCLKIATFFPLLALHDSLSEVLTLVFWDQKNQTKKK